MPKLAAGIEKKKPTSVRMSPDDLNRLEILNKIPQYPKHQVKSKFFSLLIRDRCDFLRESYSSRTDLNETETEVLELLRGMDNGN